MRDDGSYRDRRQMVPPEGIPLHFDIARAGDRAGAFLYDIIIQFVLLLVIIVGVRLASGGGGWMAAFALLLLFFVRTFYFIWFETRSQGRTPGKKRAGIRVMDARAGPLRTDAVVVRNLLRELEVWIPLIFIVAPEQIWPGAPGSLRLLFTAWAFVFACMPLFNKDRLRVGDMVAGTIVVYSPKVVLLPDLGGQEIKRRELKGEDARYTFTKKQLDVYGIYELQTLEELLRRTDRHRKKAFDIVAAQIRKKTGGWSSERVHAQRFLNEFYTALRDHLEHKMLLGKRKADKYSKE